MEQWKVGEGGVREGIIRITLNIKENRNERLLVATCNHVIVIRRRRFAC